MLKRVVKLLNVNFDIYCQAICEFVGRQKEICPKCLPPWNQSLYPWTSVEWGVWIWGSGYRGIKNPDHKKTTIIFGKNVEF